MPRKNYIHDIQRFPIVVIFFKDITSWLIDSKARNKCLEIVVSTLKNKKMNKLIGVKSRGFFWNTHRAGIKNCFYSSAKS